MQAPGYPQSSDHRRSQANDASQTARTPAAKSHSDGRRAVSRGHADRRDEGLPRSEAALQGCRSNPPYASAFDLDQESVAAERARWRREDHGRCGRGPRSARQDTVNSPARKRPGRCAAGFAVRRTWCQPILMMAPGATEGRRRTRSEVSWSESSRALIKGSVRRASGHMRLMVHLVEASGGRHLWSETYDRARSDQGRNGRSGRLRDRLAGVSAPVRVSGPSSP